MQPKMISEIYIEEFVRAAIRTTRISEQPTGTGPRKIGFRLTWRLFRCRSQPILAPWLFVSRSNVKKPISWKSYPLRNKLKQADVVLGFLKDT